MATNHPRGPKHLIIACAVLFLAGGSCDGAEGFGELTLRIQSARNLLPLEPVPVVTTLLNEQEEPVRATFVMMASTSYLQFFLAEDGEPFQVFRDSSWGVSEVRPGKARPLEPGVIRRRSHHLYYNNRKGYACSAPGIYRLKARVKDPQSDQTKESNVLEIEVVEPEGVDAEAYEFLKEAGPILMPAPMLGREGWLKRKEFLERFPDSRYARYIHYTLGRNYSFESDAAWAELEKAASYEDFFLADDALGLLVEYAAERGEFDKAEEYLAELERRFPDSTKVLEASGVLRRIRRSHE